MSEKSSHLSIHGIIGMCGNQKVFLGFATAKILYKCSFADILNEDTGLGYQRPPNFAHSKNFRQYIVKTDSSTIPLTFNLRNNLSEFWSISQGSNNNALLLLDTNTPSLARVDCQHRISAMGESELSFAFMTYIGLDLRIEMSLFNIINSKAKGLSSSLTDYHQSKLLEDLISEAPHLYIARRLNEDTNSPWFKQIRYGGETTSGLKRRTSFRMMQTTIKRLQSRCSWSSIYPQIEDQYSIILLYWNTVKDLFSQEWADPRYNLLTKGIGLYSMTELLADFINKFGIQVLSKKILEDQLAPLIGKKLWSSSGPYSNAGGKKGASEVYSNLKQRISI